MSIFDRLKQNWTDIWEDPPGKRFRNQYKRRQQYRKNTLQRIGMVGSGILIVGAGIFFLPAPGPGTLIILIGLALIAREFLALARFLDWSEIKIRRWIAAGQKKWERTSFSARLLITLSVVILTGAMAFGAYWLFINW